MLSWQRKRIESDRRNVKTPTGLNYSNERALNGVEGLPDFGAGIRSKRTIDFMVMARLRVSGLLAYYYVQESHIQRRVNVGSVTDMPRYLDELSLDALIQLDADDARDAASGKVSILGDDASVTKINDGTLVREVEQQHSYLEPFLIKGFLDSYDQSQEADMDGLNETFDMGFSVPRLLCERIGFRPRVNDVIYFGDVEKYGKDMGGYYDIEKVDRVKTRRGRTGFFTCYTLELKRESSDAPELKGLKPPPDFETGDF